MLVRSPDMGRRHQLSIELVGPAVVRAYDAGPPASWRLNQHGAPMTADVMDYAKCRAIAQHEHRLTQYRDREQISLRRHIRGQPDTHPRALEHRFALEPKEGRVRK